VKASIAITEANMIVKIFCFIFNYFFKFLYLIL